MPARFSKAFILTTLGLIVFASLFIVHRPGQTYVDPFSLKVFGQGGVEENHSLHVKSEHGGVIMPKLGNATAKAELGRASWKLLHTMTLRFPDKPTDDQRSALESYFRLFSRLYPCGECAEEFQELLKNYPPQTSSRKAASLWLCFVHNLVNERLRKPQFDCLKLDETYDCGCADDSKLSAGRSAKDTRQEDDVTGIKVIAGG